MRGACCWRALEETQTQDGTGALRLSTEITPPLSSPRRPAPNRGSGRAPRGHASRRRATYTVHHRRARAQRSATDRRLSRRPTSPRKVRPSVSPNCNTAHHKPAAPDSDHPLPRPHAARCWRARAAARPPLSPRRRLAARAGRRGRGRASLLPSSRRRQTRAAPTGTAASAVPPRRRAAGSSPARATRAPIRATSKARMRRLAQAPCALGELPRRVAAGAQDLNEQFLTGGTRTIDPLPGRESRAW